LLTQLSIDTDSPVNPEALTVRHETL